MKKKENLSLYRQTVNWIKEIPHKLEILLNNLYAMASSIACIAVGLYMVLEVIPGLHGYVAVIGLVASITVAVDGGFRLVKFLIDRS